MEEKMAKTKQYIFIAAGTMIVIIGCGIAFLNIPIIEKVFERKDMLEEKKMELDSMRSDAAGANKYSDLISSFSADRELIDEAMIKNDSVVGFIEEIEKISQAVGNEIEISHLEESKKNKIATPTVTTEAEDGASNSNSDQSESASKKSVILRIVLRGDYKQFLQSYYRLENMPYVFTIESFQINKSASSRGLQKLSEEEIMKMNSGEIVISFPVK